MILLDTHIWVWWTSSPDKLTVEQMDAILAKEADIIGISTISCWEIAKLVERGRLKLDCSIDEWFSLALQYPGVQLLELTPAIAPASTRLPGEFHRDPADQIIVATARIFNCPLITSDEKIISYPHVQTIPEELPQI